MNYDTKQKRAERVAIAKDALSWIQKGALIPTHQVYLNPEFNPYCNADGSRAFMHDQIDHKQLRDVVLGKCEVCAKGALFLAKAVRYNNVVVVQMNEADGDWDGAPLREHFSQAQLQLIEAAFEGFDYDTHRGHSAARTFYNRFYTATQRLTAILENIIRNDGEFVINDNGV